MFNLGAGVCSDQIGQAPDKCGVALVDANSALANDALELSGTGANPLGGADVRTGGGDVGGVARSRVCQHEPVGE